MYLAKIVSFIYMVLVCAVPASAVTNLVLSSPGGSGYVLSGQGVEGAAAVECTVTYDPAQLGNPKVELGTLAAGAMMAVNPNTPGTIRIAIIRTSPMNGSGTIAAISFERKGEKSGRVNVLSAKMITLDGKPLPLSVQVLNPAEPSAPASASVPGQGTGLQQGTAAGTGSVAQTQPGALPVIGGVIAVPSKQEGPARTGDARAQRDQGGPPERPVDTKEPARMAKRSDDASPQTASRKIYSQRSVLERFQEYRGTPAMKAYLELFEQEGMIGFRQDPPVALADGRSTVRVSFISSSPTRTSSDIALMGAKLVSFKRDAEFTNTFVIELQPVKGEMSASVSVPQDAVLMVYPLTVARKVDIDILKNGNVDETAFKAFLAERGTREKPKYDLNGDGRRDYLDDYLFTANYLVAREKGKASKGR